MEHPLVVIVVCVKGFIGFQLGDGGEIKAQKFKSAQMFIRIPNAQFSTTAPLLPNRCSALPFIHKVNRQLRLSILVNDLSQYSKSNHLKFYHIRE